MMIYPAVDIRDGKCVLRQGSYSDMTVYGDDPWRWLFDGRKRVPIFFMWWTWTAPGAGKNNRDIIGGGS